jgi:hypothetical protein
MTTTKTSKTKAVARRSALLTAVLCCAVLIPAAGASASAKSIKQAIKAYIPKLDVAEGHVVTAIGEYKEKHEPAVVETALTETVTVVRAMEAKVAKQPAGSPKVKKAKAKIVAGLKAIAGAYQDLANAFADKAPAPETAKSELEKSKDAIKHGARELLEGTKLLKHA